MECPNLRIMQKRVTVIASNNEDGRGGDSIWTDNFWAGPEIFDLYTNPLS